MTYGQLTWQESEAMFKSAVREQGGYFSNYNRPFVQLLFSNCCAEQFQGSVARLNMVHLISLQN